MTAIPYDYKMLELRKKQIEDEIKINNIIPANIGKKIKNQKLNIMKIFKLTCLEFSINIHKFLFKPYIQPFVLAKELKDIDNKFFFIFKTILFPILLVSVIVICLLVYCGG